jgi:phage tail sheath protein FI
MSAPVFGIQFLDDDVESRPVVASDLSTVCFIGTAPDANPELFPYNIAHRVLATDLLSMSALGKTGTLPDAVAGCNAQLGDFQMSADIFIIRVEEGATEWATIANIIGSATDLTGIHAVLRVGPDQGVTPRLICVPGYTHQQNTGLGELDIATYGSGMTVAPAVSFTGGGNDPAKVMPTATAILGTGLDADKVVSIVIDDQGSNLVGSLLVSFDVSGDPGAIAPTAIAKIDVLANPVCAALPEVLNKLLAHAVVEGPGTNNQAIIAWRETMASKRLIPIDMWVRVLEGEEIVTRPGAPRVIGLGVRRDHQFNGVPGHSWANQPIQGIIGFARTIDFSLTDGSTTGQILLAANVGIGVRGEMGVESAIASSGFNFIGTDNSYDDALWQFYNVTRMRDYIRLGLMRTWRYYLGKYNITKRTVDVVLDTAKFWLRDLKASDDILGYKVAFEADKNSPENLRLGRIRVSFAAEEPPVLRRIDADSRRYREALDELIQQLATSSGQFADINATR